MREVLPDLDRGPATPGACERGGILKRALEELDREHAPGDEGARGEVEQAAENVEPVVSAVERKLRLVVRHFGGDLLAQHGGGNIGRV